MKQSFSKCIVNFIRDYMSDINFIFGPYSRTGTPSFADSMEALFFAKLIHAMAATIYKSGYTLHFTLRKRFNAGRYVGRSNVSDEKPPGS